MIVEKQTELTTAHHLLQKKHFYLLVLIIDSISISAFWKLFQTLESLTCQVLAHFLQNWFSVQSEVMSDLGRSFTEVSFFNFAPKVFNLGKARFLLLNSFSFSDLVYSSQRQMRLYLLRSNLVYSQSWDCSNFFNNWLVTFSKLSFHCSNGDARNSNSVPYTFKSFLMWSSIRNVLLYSPLLPGLLNFLTRGLPNDSAFYDRSMSLLYLLHHLLLQSVKPITPTN